MRSRQKTQDKAPYIDVGQRTDLSQRQGLTWSKREVGARIPLPNTYARLTREPVATMARALYRSDMWGVKGRECGTGCADRSLYAGEAPHPVSRMTLSGHVSNICRKASASRAVAVRPQSLLMVLQSMA